MRKKFYSVIGPQIFFGGPSQSKFQMQYLLVILIVVILLIGGYYAYQSYEKSQKGKRHHHKKAQEAQIQQASSSLPKPARPPYSQPTWASTGAWSIPFKVRYAIAFEKNGKTGPLSDWTPFYSSSEFSNPILTRFPVVSANAQDPNNPDSVLVYRQFQTQPPKLIYKLPYPFLSQLVDKRPDAY
jgi:hypothetical protein